MKKYNVAVVWSLMGSYDIEAENEDEARRIADELPLPTDGEYLSDSFEVDFIEELPE
jgi:hypothetical protein